MARLTRTKCARCGASCFFVCRIGNDWVCVECFGVHVGTVAAHFDNPDDGIPTKNETKVS